MPNDMATDGPPHTRPVARQSATTWRSVLFWGGISLFGTLVVFALWPMSGWQPWDEMVDARRYADAQAVDQHLEGALVDKWRSGPGTFSLHDITDMQVGTACVLSWNYRIMDNPGRTLALLSDRPWFWRVNEGNNTLVVEFLNGSVRAFRLRSSSRHREHPRIIRFTFADPNSDTVCADAGQIAFERRSGNGAAAFIVRGR